MSPSPILRTGLLVLLALPLTGFARCDTTPKWKLVWSDEFTGPAGQSPDPGHWAFDIGTGSGGWGNQQLEYDTDRPENASLDGKGHLAITARHESYQGAAYTSARLVTRGLLERKYGRFEARMKLPSGQGMWPAFWLLGANVDTVGWPDCGEIDIMENRGQEPMKVTGSLHGPGYAGGSAITASKYLDGNVGFDGAFHTFGLEWTPDWIAWDLDGKTWQVVVRADLPDGGKWVFDHPFYLILDLAVGGTYVGAPDPSVLPQTLLVDWVRVYAPAS